MAGDTPLAISRSLLSFPAPAPHPTPRTRPRSPCPRAESRPRGARPHHPPPPRRQPILLRGRAGARCLRGSGRAVCPPLPPPTPEAETRSPRSGDTSQPRLGNRGTRARGAAPGGGPTLHQVGRAVVGYPEVFLRPGGSTRGPWSARAAFKEADLGW